MKNLDAIYGLIRKKFIEVGLEPKEFTLGKEYQDESYALYFHDGFWYVGTNERGKAHEEARFNSPASAAEYIIFNILKGTPKVIFPEIDWTEYASLT